MTRVAVWKPRWTLAFVAISVLACVVLSITGLKFKTSRLDLLAPDSNYNSRWLNYLAEFDRDDDALIVIDGRDPEAVKQALQSTGELLSHDPNLQGVLYRSPLGGLRKKALFLVPEPYLELVANGLQMLAWQTGEPVSPAAISSASATNYIHNNNSETAFDPDVPMVRLDTVGHESDSTIQNVGSLTSGTDLSDQLRRLAIVTAYAPPDPNSSSSANLHNTFQTIDPGPAHVTGEHGPVIMPTPSRSGREWLLQWLYDELESLRISLEGNAPPPLPNWTTQFRQLLTSLPIAEGEDDLLLEDEGQLGFCLVRVPHPDQNPVVAAKTINSIRDHISNLARQHPTVHFGLTGMPILEYDEGQSTQSDMTLSSVISLIGVAIVFIVAFGSLRLPMLAVTALGVGLAWTMGFATLGVGHLNLLSAAFGAILIGLGIDFGIHFLTRFRALETEAPDLNLTQRCVEAARQVGPSILTGGITTAVAFGCSSLTPFRGISELGIISGGGTLLCVAAALFVLPALLVCFAGRKTRAITKSAPAVPGDCVASVHPASQNPIHIFTFWVTKYPYTSVSLVLLFTAIIGWKSTRVRFDHNLLHLQAEGLSSVVTEELLIQRSGQSVWFAISMADSPEKARQLREQYERLPEVSRVEEIGSLFCSDSQSHQRQSAVAQCLHAAQHLDAVAQQVSYNIDLRQISHQLRSIIDLANRGVFAGSQNDSFSTTEINFSSADSSINLSESARESLERLYRLPPQIATARVNHWLKQRTLARQELAGQVSSVASLYPPQLSDLSDAVQTRMRSEGGKFLIRAFAKEDIWDRENLGRFVSQLEKIDPHVTGHPIQTYYAGGELQSSYAHAAIYALLAVAAILMVDLGSIRLVGFVLIPTALAIVQMFGLMAWLDMPLNAANMIALPLIIGIGIDDGVHVVYDFLHRREKYQIKNSTAMAVVLTSVTTIVGFGSMLIASHQGLQSLGAVFIIGVAACMLNSLVFLPAILTLVQHRFPAHYVHSDQINTLFPPQSQFLENNGTTVDSLVSTSPTLKFPIALRHADIPTIFSAPELPASSNETPLDFRTQPRRRIG